MRRRLPFLGLIAFCISVATCWLLLCGVPVSYAPVLWQHYARPEGSQRLVLGSQQDLEAWWTANTTHYLTPQPAPTVDFNSERVAVVSMGLCPTSGYGITITAIHETLDSLDIVVSDRTPGFLESRRCAVTNPYDMVRFKPVGKRVRFVESRSSWRLGLISGATGVLAVLLFQSWRRRRSVLKAAAAT